MKIVEMSPERFTYHLLCFYPRVAPSAVTSGTRVADFIGESGRRLHPRSARRETGLCGGATNDAQRAGWVTSKQTEVTLAMTGKSVQPLK